MKKYCATPEPENDEGFSEEGCVRCGWTEETKFKVRDEARLKDSSLPFSIVEVRGEFVNFGSFNWYHQDDLELVVPPCTHEVKVCTKCGTEVE